MRRGWRWFVVAGGTAVLVALPFVAQLLPAGHSDLSATSLLQRIRASAAVGYSGYAQSSGGLSLPLQSDPFDSVETLFGGTKQLRVWWRNPSDWRVDTLSVTGESDLHHDARGDWTWNYEANTARFTRGTTTPVVRLPRSEDLLPTTLARRLLSETDPSQVSRLPSARIAGRSSAGLRVRVEDTRSTVRRIDVWADPRTGVATRVAVYGTSGRPLVSTTFLDLTITAPSPSVVAFRPVAGARTSDGQVSDIVAAIDRFGRSTPPDQVAGLPRRRDLQLGAVGVYGRGATVLVALPLDPRLARSVVPSLSAAAGALENAAGISIGTGAVNLQLTPQYGRGGRWLLVGTVQKATLQQAVPGLPPIRGFEFGR